MRNQPWRAMLALFGVLALFGLAGCGDDDAGGDTTSPEPNGEAAAAPDGDFCEQVAGAEQYFRPPADGTEYAEYLAVLSSIEPPPEIASDWAVMLAGIEVFVDVDFDDPDAADAAFEDPAFAASIEADMQITEFVLEECGIDLDAG